MKSFVGIDCGTSAVKLVALNDDGDVVAMASRSYPLHQPFAGWSEQAPDDWWSATLDAAAELKSLIPGGLSECKGVSLSGQMHGLVLPDERALSSHGREGSVLRPAILWNDQRTGAQCKEIEREFGGREECVRRVGNAPLSGFTLPKLLWLREHEPAIFARVKKILLPKDWLLFRLTGECATDVGDASGTLLFDPAARTWSEFAIGRSRLDASWLPRVVESGQVIGEVASHVAERMGLPAGVPVTVGSGDNMMGAVGAGVVREGVSLVTIGTSGVVYSHMERPRLDLPKGRVHTMCAATGSSTHPGGWCMTGCTLSAGGSLAWAKERMWPEASYEQLFAEASAAPAGSDGVTFLPYLTGERCPYPAPMATGGWVGLTSRHHRGHLVRAILEGVAMTLAQIVEIQQDAGVRIDQIRVGGGGVKSPLWRQILSDALGLPLFMPTTEEGPAFGAALLALASHVKSDTPSLCDRIISVTACSDPQPSELLQRRQSLDALFHRLEPTFLVRS